MAISYYGCLVLCLGLLRGGTITSILPDIRVIQPKSNQPKYFLYCWCELTSCQLWGKVHLSYQYSDFSAWNSVQVSVLVNLQNSSLSLKIKSARQKAQIFSRKLKGVGIPERERLRSGSNFCLVSFSTSLIHELDPDVFSKCDSDMLWSHFESVRLESNPQNVTPTGVQPKIPSHIFFFLLRFARNSQGWPYLVVCEERWLTDVTYSRNMADFPYAPLAINYLISSPNFHRNLSIFNDKLWKLNAETSQIFRSKKIIVVSLVS